MQHELDELGFALDHAGDGSLMFCTDDAVEFPIPNAGFCLYNRRALRDVHPPRYHAAPRLRAANSVACLKR